MKETLEKLWNECFAEECAVIGTEEERTLLKKAITLRNAVNEALTKEQSESVEKYVEAFYELQGFLLKKAFFKGCEFAVSFLFEAGKLGKG